MAGIHDFEMQTITGQTVSLSDYAGKVCLIVNVASE
jgi:glutathione peroxidase-family protein